MRLLLCCRIIKKCQKWKKKYAWRRSRRRRMLSNITTSCIFSMAWMNVVWPDFTIRTSYLLLLLLLLLLFVTAAGYDHLCTHLFCNCSRKKTQPPLRAKNHFLSCICCGKCVSNSTHILFDSAPKPERAK